MAADKPTTAPTPSDRIRDLSTLNAQIPELVSSAGHTLASLSSSPQNPAEVETNKTALESHVTAFYTTLQSLTVSLRRHAYALEEAGIIASEAPGLSSTNANQQGSGMGGKAGGAGGLGLEPERITNGGLGNLDIGWLNSRGNKVGAEKEGELVEEARVLAEKLVEEGRKGRKEGKEGREDGDDTGDEMELG